MNVDAGSLDLLGADAETATLATLIAARGTAGPLSLGLFGAADSGVSFFMHRVRDRVHWLTAVMPAQSDGPYLRNVVQVEYNAWHYAGSHAAISLVEVVFNELDRSIETFADRDDGDRVFAMLGTSRRLRRALEADVTRAQAVAMRAEQELAVAADEHEVAMEQVGAAASRARWDEVTVELTRRFADMPDVAAEIDADGLCLGFETLSGTPEEMDKILENGRTVAGRAGLLTSSLVARRHASNTFLVAIGLLILVGIAVVLGRLLAISPTATAMDVGGKAITLLSALIGVVGLWLAFVARNQTLSAIVRLRKREPLLREVIRRVDGAFAQDVALAQERLVSARKRIDDARAQLAPARADLARAEQARSDFERDGVLRRVTEFYREQLRRSGDGVSASVIPFIREDFQVLSASMPPVERIVVYISDLDRCPPAVAVDVLQATQLLLDFPLFVVVVATDPRWLLRAVAPRYRQLLGRDASESGGAEPTGLDAENDSIDYLSRVFQIPFWLRPLDRVAARRVVRALFPSDATPVPSVTLPATSIEPPTAAAVSEEVFSAREKLTAAEIDAIERVAGLSVQSVRDAKRLVIAYRLLRASMSDYERSAFAGDAGAPPAYHAIVTQLAIVGAAPQLTRRYFDVLTSEGLHTVSDLLERLAADESVVSHPEWDTLRAVLEDYTRDGDDEPALRALVRWYGAAARHSFAPAGGLA